MKLSIVTPVYNDPRIERCLESIGSQEGEFELEHIVVDGQSTDETVDILAEYDDQIDCLIREDDDGLFDAMNKGIARATGDIIGILNADDRYQDESVLADVAETLSETELDACYGDLVYVDERDRVVRYWQSGRYTPRKFFFGWMPPHPTFFVRRELYDEYGQFDLSYSIAADYEFMLRLLLAHEIDVGYVDRILVRMELGGESNSLRNLSTIIKDMYRAWRTHHPRGRFVAPFMHPIEKATQYIRKPSEGGAPSSG